MKTTVAAESTPVELIDTGIFDNNRSFNEYLEYTSRILRTVLIQITVADRAPEPAQLHLPPNYLVPEIPGRRDPEPTRPMFGVLPVGSRLTSPLQSRWLFCDGAPTLIFTENETNANKLLRLKRKPFSAKKSRHQRYVVSRNQRGGISATQSGSQASAHYG